MNKTIKFLALILVFLFTVSLCACGDKNNSTQKTDDTSAPVVQETVQATQTPIDYDNLVTDAVCEKLEYDGQTYYYYVPQINLPDGRADEVNEQMLSHGQSFIDSAYESVDLGVSVINSGYRYLWGYKDNVVSVLSASFMNTPGFQYQVYNASIDTGEALTNDDLRQLYGYSESELYDLIKEKAEAKYEEKYLEIKDQVGDMYYTMYDSTLSQENLEKSVLYINGEGDLCCVTTIYSLAGANSYDHVLNISGDTAAQDPDFS